MNSLIAIAAASLYLDAAASRADDEDDEDLDDGSDDTTDEEPEAVVAKPAKSSKKKVKKGGKKVASKKEGKKVAAKTDKNDKNIVRLKDLAKAAKLTEAVTRKKLRDAEVPRGEGRWAWELGSKALKQARKALGLAA